MTVTPRLLLLFPRHSMYAYVYAIYAYIEVVLGVNVGIYGIHGVFGFLQLTCLGTAMWQCIHRFLEGWKVTFHGGSSHATFA